jgi:TonB family protein
MFAFFIKSAGICLKLALATLISFLFFILIPLVHELFGPEKVVNSKDTSRPAIIAELIQQPEKNEKKQTQSRIRKIQASSGNKGTSDRIDFKFTPDLGVGGGEGVAIEQQGSLEAVIFEEGEVDENATLITPFQIPYPPRAVELGIEGILEANLTVGIDGKVINIDIIASPHSSITAEARKVFSSLKFKPAKNKGIPVNMKLKQIVEFKLDS